MWGSDAIPGRSRMRALGWYVHVDRPKTHRPKRGGKMVRRKAGDSREEALRNALRIEATLGQKACIQPDTSLVWVNLLDL